MNTKSIFTKALFIVLLFWTAPAYSAEDSSTTPSSLTCPNPKKNTPEILLNRPDKPVVFLCGFIYSRPPSHIHASESEIFFTQGKDIQKIFEISALEEYFFLKKSDKIIVKKVLSMKALIENEVLTTGTTVFRREITCSNQTCTISEERCIKNTYFQKHKNPELPKRFKAELTQKGLVHMHDHQMELLDGLLVNSLAGDKTSKALFLDLLDDPSRDGALSQYLVQRASLIERMESMGCIPN